MRRLALLLVAMICFLGLAGCRQVHERPEEAQSAAEGQQELIVFHEKGSSSYIVQNFQTVYPDIPVKTVSFGKFDQIEDLIQKHGNPDLILFGTETSREKWAKSEYLADITSRCASDVSFSEADYFPGIRSLGVINESLYALPLGMETHYITVRDEIWQDSAFQELPDQYTAEELFDALEKEIDKEREGAYFVLPPISKDGLGYVAEWLLDSGALKMENGQVQMDPQLHEQICRMVAKQQQNFEECLDLLNQEGSYSMRLDPRFLGGRYVANVWNAAYTAAPQIGLVYAQSANRTVLEQDVYVLFIPMSGTPDQYAAKVSVFGGVGSRSARQDEAYEVLRKMMDMPTEIWKISMSGDDASFPYSVNRQQALAMIQTVEESGDSEFIIGSDGVAAPKQQLSEELRAKLEEYLNNIAYVYACDSELDTWWPFIGAATNDYRVFYEPMVNALEKYIETGEME